MYKEYKKAQSLLSELETQLKIFDEHNNEKVEALYEVFEYYRATITNDVLEVDDYIQYCEKFRTPRGFAVDQLFELMYYNETMSFKKFCRECDIIKNYIIEEKKKLYDAKAV